ncbi:MAG TPA: metal ABC transporter permease [Cytophagaceae bacterium]
MNDVLIILMGCLVAVSCGLLGCFLVLRKMAMVGDAISHAVLPGIVVTYLITGSRESVLMLLGAGLIGILTTVLIEFFHKKARLQEDASIGVTFTWLFALGVILISYYAGNIDLDQDCVLYGEIAYVPFEPESIWVMGIVLILNIAFILLFYKQLFITTFDPAYAAAIGISTVLWHYFLMAMVSFTTVAAFESVGAILVVAFLVAPPATAYLLTEKLPVMLYLTAITGIIAAVGGYFLAGLLDGSISGAMSTVVGLEFGLALLFAPKTGILTKKFAHSSGKEALIQ